MIKHEIRWEYILVICIILGTLPCNAQSVIPMPKEMVMGEGSWDVSADTRINYSNDALTKTVSLFNNYLDGRFGVTLKKGSKGKNAIHLQIDKKMPLEAYSLVVDDKGVTIKGSEAGIFYGIQTLQQLLVDKGNGCIQLPYIMINDEPRFGYRGLMLDVARYFYSVEYVKEYIDLMARYKINTWREDKFERSVANGTETVFVTLRFCVVRKQLKATLKPNAAGVQLPPHYYRNG